MKFSLNLTSYTPVSYNVCMHNILINEQALLIATQTTLKLSYAEQEVVDDIVFEFAKEETEEIIKAYLAACSLRLV